MNPRERLLMNYEPSELNVADPEERTTPRIPGRAESPTPSPASPGGAERTSRVEALHATRRVRLERRDAYYGDNHAVRDLDLTCQPGHVTALIRPSGGGQETRVRCVNRMHEERPGS